MAAVPVDVTSEVITARTLGEIWGWSEDTAHRWLKEQESKHGSAVVLRRGRRLFTTRTQLATIGVVLPAAVDPRVERRLAALEEAAAEQATRTDALSAQIIEFRRKSHEWMKRAR